MEIIINADDYGMSEHVNHAIVDSFQKGWISSTTIMVNMAYAEEAVALSKKHGFFDRVGLHFNLSEGIPITDGFSDPLFINERNEFTGAYRFGFKSQFFISENSKRAIVREAEAQVRKYLDFGFSLMHCDSHHHVHNYYSVFSALGPILQKYGFKSVRLAKNRNKNVRPDKRLYKYLFNSYLHRHYKRRIDYFMSFPEYYDLCDEDFGNALIELMCHPDYEGGTLINRGSMGFEELLAVLPGNKLLSYGDLA